MLFLPVLFTAIYRTAIYYIVLRYICQLSDFFPRLRWSLATSTLYTVVRILAERFLLCMKTISCKVKSTEQISPFNASYVLLKNFQNYAADNPLNPDSHPVLSFHHQTDIHNVLGIHPAHWFCLLHE